eukprot:6191066-Pleurochrysis_carterae.AAC.1
MNRSSVDGRVIQISVERARRTRLKHASTPHQLCCIRLSQLTSLSQPFARRGVQPVCCAPLQKLSLSSVFSARDYELARPSDCSCRRRRAWLSSSSSVQF